MFLFFQVRKSYLYYLKTLSSPPFIWIANNCELKTVFYVSSSLMLQMLKILNRIGCPVFLEVPKLDLKS